MARSHFSLMGRPTVESPVTINVVSDALAAIGIETLKLPKNPGRRVSWCLLASVDKDERYDLPFKESELLYLIGPAELGKTVEEHPQSAVAVVLGHGATVDEDEFVTGAYASRHVFVLREPERELELSSIVSDVQLLIHHMQLWSTRLQSAVAIGRSMQDLMDIGEELFGNHMNVSDATYVLVAHTRNIAPPPGINADLVQRGFHDQPAVARAREAGLFSQWKWQDGVELFEPNKEIPCPFMTYVMRIEDQYRGHVVMCCNNRPPSDGQADLFAVFAKACYKMMRAELMVRSQARPLFFSFVNRLLTDSRCSQSYVDAQAELAGLPSNGYFQLAMVEYHESGFSDQASYLVSILLKQFPTELVLFYENRILILLSSVDEPLFRTRDVEKELTGFCNQYRCCAYVSDVFERLRDLRFAYLQVKAEESLKDLIDIGLRPLDDISERRVFSFDGAFSYVCFSEDYDEEFKGFCINHSPLDKLSRAEQTSDVSDVRLLYYYLFNERKATPAGKQLGMHRNSVNYRIENIQRRYGINLERFETRERLMNSYRLKIMSDPTFRDMLI